LQCLFTPDTSCLHFTGPHGHPDGQETLLRIKPNRTVLEGEVLEIRRCADGVGADVTLRVDANLGAAGAEDFTGARPGDALMLFTATPEALARSHRYRIDVSVLGGPEGERLVCGRADEIGPR
jgi:hypothetical protein